MALAKFRDEINSIDDHLLELLSQRRQVCRRVIQLKEERDMPLRDAQREEELLARLIRKGRQLGLDAYFVTRVFHELIDDSVRSQQLFLQKALNREEAKPLRVTYQGIDGAYSHLASKKFFADRLDTATFKGYPTFAEVVEQVEEDVADYGLLPVENTTAGSINEVYELLSRTKLSIVGEEVFRVQHCLLAIRDVPVGAIRKVYSHPQALAQCTHFLSRLDNCQREYFADTAMAVQKIKEDQDASQAAIASEEAAQLYGLRILERNIADHPENFTRFVVVGRKPIQVDPRIPCKTSLIMATYHKEGALLHALAVFHEAKLNLTKIESRPKPGSPFEYVFYLDFEGNTVEEHVQAALEKLSGATSYLRILGSYPIEMRGKTRPSVQSFLPDQREKKQPQPTGGTERHAEVAGAKSTRTPPPENSATGAPGFPRRSADATYKLASRETKPEDTVVKVRDVEIGGPEFVVIAGPCSVESEEQIRGCAREVKECGGKILRGGCFRPRTSPYSFQGLGFQGLELLVRAGREYDLPIITEVLSPSDVEPVARLADILQIGARNMQNFSLLNEVGKVNRPVMLKRGISASIEEFLSAAEYILAQGNHQVILCERGIRTFETVTRNMLDLGAIPILKRLTHLPVVVDPSHAAGQRDLVIPLARAAHAVGPHGMMVEIHPRPEEALSDGPQALRFDDFAQLMGEIYGDQKAGTG